MYSLLRAGRGDILELGCGSGRLLLPLAQAGFTVTGVELSTRMLELARLRVEAAGASRQVRLVQGDFERAELGGPYGLAFCAMNTFMHLLSQRQQLRALHHWRHSLDDRGLLLLDLFNPDVAELAALDGQVQFDRSWIDAETGGTVMKQFIRVAEPALQMIHASMLYDLVLPGGELRRTTVTYDIRYLWLPEAELLLHRAGYALEDVYGDFDGSGYGSDSPRMILLARRRR